jgi:hypothetical protein
MIITASTYAHPGDVAIEESSVDPKDICVRFDKAGDFRMYMPKTEAVELANKILAACGGSQ